MAVKINRWIPLIIYVVGLGVISHYIFTNNYLSGATIENEYALYIKYVEGATWHPMTGLYQLQNSCLTVTLFPALIQRLVGIEPMLFYKLYHLVLIPFLPVVVYFLVKQFVEQEYALVCVLFVMAQMAFIQSPSMARTNIALIFYALILLAIFKSDLRYRMPLAVAASILLAISHYSSSYIALAIIGSGLLVVLYKRVRCKVKISQLPILASVFVVLLVSTFIWGSIVNKNIGRGIIFYDTKIAPSLSSGTEETAVSLVTPEADKDEGVKPLPLFDLDTRDKMIQVAFGITHPDGDTNFKMNWFLWVVSWVSIGLLIFGFVILLKRKDKFLLHKTMCLASLCLIGILIVVPYASRGYGIERMYYQSLFLLSPCLALVCERISNKLRANPFVLMIPLVLSLGILNYISGQILSIKG
jgi:uncharacterized membrane protein